MKIIRYSVALLGLVAMLAGGAISAGAPFTPGNLVVVRVGPGNGSGGALDGTATTVFLEEHPTGVHLTPLQTIGLQSTSATSGNRALTLSGSSTSEGFLTLSADGRYLLLGGYN